MDTDPVDIEWQNCNEISSAKTIMSLKSAAFDGNYFVLKYDSSNPWPINSNDKECYGCYIIKRNDKWVGNIFSRFESHPNMVDACDLIYMSKNINRPIRGERIGFCLLSLDKTSKSNYCFSQWI